MNTLENISRVGTWKTSVDSLNRNFTILGQELENFIIDSNKSKGLFPSVSDLNQFFPNPKTGDWAYVGTSFPASIYIGKDGQWVNTEYTGGNGEIDPKIYANSVQTSTSIIESLFTSRSTWKYNSNNTGWTNYSNGIKIVSSDNVSYEVRPNSIQFGEEGELLENSSDPNLKKFIDEASLKTVIITSSDGISKSFGEDSQLTWTIDKTYYYQTVNEEIVERDPVQGDEFNIVLKFNSKSGDEGTLNLNFKFIL